MDSHVHTPAVVEAQRAMHRRSPSRSRQRALPKCAANAISHPRQRSRREDAIAIVTVGDLGCLGRFLASLVASDSSALAISVSSRTRLARDSARSDSLRARSNSSRTRPTKPAMPRPPPPAVWLRRALAGGDRSGGRRQPSCRRFAPRQVLAVQGSPQNGSSCASAMAASAFSNCVRGAAPGLSPGRAFSTSAPRTQLEKAEAAIGDAQDEAILRRTLLRPGLTAEQTDDMNAAAGRRFESPPASARRSQTAGGAGRGIAGFVGRVPGGVDRARKESDLAESRASLVRELTEMAKAEESLATNWPRNRPRHPRSPTVTMAMASSRRERWRGWKWRSPHTSASRCR